MYIYIYIYIYLLMVSPHFLLLAPFHNFPYPLITSAFCLCQIHLEQLLFPKKSIVCFIILLFLSYFGKLYGYESVITVNECHKCGTVHLSCVELCAVCCVFTWVSCVSRHFLFVKEDVLLFPLQLYRANSCVVSGPWILFPKFLSSWCVR
jgi:hypothetical protein